MIPEQTQLAIARIENGKTKYVGLHKLDGKVYAIVNKEKQFRAKQMDNLFQPLLYARFAKENNLSAQSAIFQVDQFSKSRYQEMVVHYIFEPLGMLNSDFDIGGTLFTTAADLSAFAISCLERGHVAVGANHSIKDLPSLRLDINQQTAFLVLSDLEPDLFTHVIEPFCPAMLAGEGIGRLIKAI